MASVMKYIFGFIKRRFFLTLWIILISYIFHNTFTYYQNERKFYHLRKLLGLGLCISRGTATAINLCAALVLLPLCHKVNHVLYRACLPCPALFFFWLERSKSFHITVATTLLLFGVLHSAAHFVNIWNFSIGYEENMKMINLAKYKNENPLNLVLSQSGLTGVGMLVIVLCMGITSVGVARRRLYNAFWYTHRLYFPFMALLTVHPLSGVLKEEILETSSEVFTYQVENSTLNEPKFVSIKSKTWQWISLPVCFFLLDLSWRMFERNRSTSDVLKVRRLDACTMSVVLRSPSAGFRCAPAQYVLLQCPRVSQLEWHPFTVVQIPTDTKREFVVWIRVKGDWTKAFERTLIERPNCTVMVDGGYPSRMERVRRSRVALCAAAGVGITPFVSLLQLMLDNPKSSLPGRVHLLWIVRSERELLWIAKLTTTLILKLNECNRPDRLHVEFYVTGKTEIAKKNTLLIVDKNGLAYHKVYKDEEKPALLTPCNIRNSDANNAQFLIDDGYKLSKDYPLLACRIRRGRPFWDRVFGHWIHLYPEDHLDLFCCGPKKLVKVLYKKCKLFSDVTTTKFSLVHENFY